MCSFLKMAECNSKHVQLLAVDGGPHLPHPLRLPKAVAHQCDRECNSEHVQRLLEVDYLQHLMIYFCIYRYL